MNILTLLADEAPSWLTEIAKPEVLGLVAPIVVVIGGVILALAFGIMRHRERIAKIEHGIDPDTKPKSTAGIDATMPCRH